MKVNTYIAFGIIVMTIVLVLISELYNIPKLKNFAIIGFASVVLIGVWLKKMEKH
jgi:hypothetical protein